MKKPRPPQVDVEALRAANAARNETDVLAAWFRQMEELRKKGELTTPYIALAALSELVSGRELGFSDDELRQAWPEEWGEVAVVVPGALLVTLRNIWAEYVDGPTGLSLGEAFRMEGRGQGKPRTRDLMKTRAFHRKLSNEVEIEYLTTGLGEKPILLDEAIRLVSVRFDVSHETVERAHKVYGRGVRQHVPKLRRRTAKG